MSRDSPASTTPGLTVILLASAHPEPEENLEQNFVCRLPPTEEKIGACALEVGARFLGMLVTMRSKRNTQARIKQLVQDEARLQSETAVSLESIEAGLSPVLSAGKDGGKQQRLTIYN